MPVGSELRDAGHPERRHILQLMHSGVRLGVLAAVVLLPAAANAQSSYPDSLARAREFIEAGRIDDAIQWAGRFLGHHPTDARGYLVLGDAWFKSMPVGRFKAAQAYQQAERLAPTDPEPAYRYAQVGLWLGGDDGEMMAREGLERLLALDPRYADAWDEWLTLFRNSGSRHEMRQRLWRFAGDPIVRARIALLDIEDEEYQKADSLLDSALTADSTNAAWLALRAQSSFEAGDTLGGWRYYRRALANAARDSTDALWHQAIGIASPAEVRAWAAGVRPERRRAWLEAFWARRNPDLFAGVNNRVAEHFARLRYARSHFPLTHPLVSYQRSQVARAMNLEPSAGERAYFQRCEMYEVLMPPEALPEIVRDNPARPKPVFDDRQGQYFFQGYSLPGVARASDQNYVNLDPFTILATPENVAFLRPWERNTLFLPLNLDLRSMDSVAARVGYNLATGLDDRGVMYLRLGAPDARAVGAKNPDDPQCHSLDVERWRYAEFGEVRFARPSAFSQGLRNIPDMVFTAMNERQFETVQIGLTQDASSELAPLEFGVWTAQFRNLMDSDLTDLAVVTTRGEAAASLVGSFGGGSVWEATDGVVTTNAAPGRYLLLAQARDSGLLGRQTLRMALRRFDSVPSLSDLLLARAWDGQGTDRDAMLARIERTLVFPEGSPIRSYAETYGLKAVSGIVHYGVMYELLKTDTPDRDIRRTEWPEATRFEFQRAKPAASDVIRETLDITPDRVRSGNYLLRLRVVDETSRLAVGRATIEFAVR